MRCVSIPWPQRDYLSLIHVQHNVRNSLLRNVINAAHEVAPFKSFDKSWKIDDQHRYPLTDIILMIHGFAELLLCSEYSHCDHDIF